MNPPGNNTGGEGAASATPDASPVRVLLIEDNPIDARLIEVMLTEANDSAFELARAERLADGLARLGNGDFQALLLDLSLPDSHGLETFTRARRHAPHLPIIVLSGLDDETVALHAVREGAQDYLVKGHVDGHLLTRAIRYAIERKQTADQLARYTDELRQRNAQMEADLEMAREVQQGFLPQQYPAFPNPAAPGENMLRFLHRYVPAAAVGGDFFIVLPLSDTEAGVFLCDVMGHGLRAALVTAILRGLVEQLRFVAGDAGRFLTEINRALRTILRERDHPILATAFYVVVDPIRGELRFASAGHPSPWLLRPAGPLVQPLNTIDARHGPALGLFSRALYPTCRAPISGGDRLLLFTDGLYEMPGADQQDYGEERLLAAVQRHIHMPPEKLFDTLLDDVRAYGGRNEFDDDVCLVSVEILRTT
ncbi:MAG TPA: SpoIIE family protein phosphatase [Verrucomicrobiae bacterium]|jgi:sigma-B regulation protein RsbU (phosphoserine phosphatase)